jgi:hypothetical protein
MQEVNQGAETILFSAPIKGQAMSLPFLFNGCR